jgi:hypothetical protein
MSHCCWVLLAYALVMGLMVSSVYAYAFTLAVFSDGRG